MPELPSNHRKRVVHYTQPGMRPRVFEIAYDPVSDIVSSKRQPLIAAEDELLDSNQQFLHEGTVARNRAYQERLDEVWRSTTDWESKLKVEVREAEETIKALKDTYQHHIYELNKLLIHEVTESFDHIDNDLIPVAPAHLGKLDDSLDKFVKKTVPDNIEALIGEISRKLSTEYEYFSIEQSKEAKREKKIVLNASLHMENTAQHFTDEEALLTACFHNLNDDVCDCERRAARLYDSKRTVAASNIVELKQAIDHMCRERVSEDNEVLDTVIETQGLLQETVLEHFGTKEFDDSSSKKKFDKLDKRMKDINRKKGETADEEDVGGSVSQRSESKDNEVEVEVDK